MGANGGDAAVTVLRGEALIARLEAVGRAVARLRPHQATSLEACLANEDEQWLVERGLPVAAEATLDACQHLVAALRLAPMEDDTQAIDRVAAAGVLPAEFATRFRQVGGFRNVLGSRLPADRRQAGPPGPLRPPRRFRRLCRVRHHLLGRSRPLMVYALGGRTDGRVGADHGGCDYTSGGAIEVDASFGQNERVAGLFEAELSE